MTPRRFEPYDFVLSDGTRLEIDNAVDADLLVEAHSAPYLSYAEHEETEARFEAGWED